MRIPIIVSVLSLLAGAQAATGENAPRLDCRWSWRPSLFVFGSIDEIGDDATDQVRDLAEASPALSLAGSAEGFWEGRRGRLQSSIFGLVRSPFSENDRSYFLAGRVHVAHSLGRAWTLTFDDSARLQRRERALPTDFQRNEFVLGFERRGQNGPGIGLRLSDRRRALPNLSELDFARQGLAFAVRVDLGRRISSEISTQWQRYSAPTATGQRLALSLEVAHIGSRGVIALHGSTWHEPLENGGERGGVYAAGPSPSDVGGREFCAVPPTTSAAQLEGSASAAGLIPGSVEAFALQESAARDAADLVSGTDIDFTGDPFLFDPLESDSDEWDFGRRKQVLVGFVSRRFGKSLHASMIARYQHKSGPNLLLPNGRKGPSYEDDRVALRATLRNQLTRRLAVFVQGCYLRSWADDRPGLVFSRTLVAIGAQIRY